MSYSATYDGVTMTFNFETEVVSIDSGTSSLQAETLQKGARDAEESTTGIVYRRIIDASGKVTLDAQSETGLTITLLRNWKVLSLKTSGLLSVGGGNVVNENTGVLIFASNPQVDTQNNTSVAGVRVSASGSGSGATPQQIWEYSSRELTTGTKDSEIDAIKTKTDQLNFNGSDVQSVASNMRGTDGANTVAPDNTSITDIKTKTDQLNFSGSDVQSVASNMRGTDGANTVAPDNTDISAIKAKTDQLNFTGSDVNSVASNMRGTDGANTVAPDNTDISAIKAKTDQLNFTGSDVNSVASNMRGTDGANTVAPNNSDVSAIKAKTDQLNFNGSDVQATTGTNEVSITEPDKVDIAGKVLDQTLP